MQSTNQVTLVAVEGGLRQAVDGSSGQLGMSALESSSVMIRRVSICLCVAFGACTVSPDDAPSKFDYIGVVAEAREADEFVALAFGILANTDSPIDAAVEDTQLLTMLGREDLAAQTGTYADGTVACTPEAGTGTSAIEQIAQAARRTSVVIINEAHDRPDHRAFIEELAARLRDDGYSIYAAETFSNFADPAFSFAVDDLAHEPFIRRGSGFYTREPVFGRLVRRVKALGYELVAYEEREDQTAGDGATRSERIEVREEAQANNLIETIFRDRPNARVLIHVGYSHAAEAPMNAGSERWMATRLKDKLEIDPLTVTQTACADGAQTSLAGAPGSIPSGAFDFFVIHRAVGFDRSRPEWRGARGDRDVDLPDAFARTTEAIVVDAHYFDEPFAATPIDRVLIRPGEDLPLLLPPGRYKVSAQSKSGPLPDIFELIVR